MLEFGVVFAIGLVILFVASRRSRQNESAAGRSDEPSRQARVAASPESPARTYPSFVAGTRYKGPTGSRAPYIWKKLAAGAALTAKAERDNPHDPDAIGLWHGAFHVGYVPQRHGWVAQSLSEGDEITIVVKEIAPSEDDRSVPFVTLTITVRDRPAHNRA
jgi:hypothetical protein